MTARKLPRFTGAGEDANQQVRSPLSSVQTIERHAARILYNCRAANARCSSINRAGDGANGDTVIEQCNRGEHQSIRRTVDVFQTDQLT